MKLSINLNSASLVTILKKNISIVLLGFLLLVLLLASYIIFQEYRKIALVRSDTSGVTGQTVRVNLSQYDSLVQALEENQRFTPQPIPGSSSFGAAPNKTTGN